MRINTLTLIKSHRTPITQHGPRFCLIRHGSNFEIGMMHRLREENTENSDDL